VKARTVAAALTALFAVGAVDEAEGRKLYHTHATCYSLSGVMADGTGVRIRSAASNLHPLGTRIRLVGRPFYGGLRRFIIRDTGSALYDGHLDIWWPSYTGCIGWGKRNITYKIGWSK
jgi:3D (Asp-Asp-Asp) domain-containing protein